jgi:hypothetical protein
MAFLISAIVIISIIAAFVLIKKQPQAVVEQPIAPTVAEPVAEVEPVVIVEEAESIEPVADLQEVKAEFKKKKPTTTKPVKKEK